MRGSLFFKTSKAAFNENPPVFARSVHMDFSVRGEEGREK